MDFARKQLEKYGWTEGKGLGKDEAGLKEALKPKPKHGTAGMGHNVADEFTNNWWQRIYDKAAENIQVNTKKNGEVQALSSNSDETFNIDRRKFVKSKSKKSYLQTFVKKATLKGNTVEEIKSKIDSSDSEEESKVKATSVILNDDELFAACGGRTAHKGARHGLKSNGKLARIDEQEKDLYDCMKRKRDLLKNKTLNNQNSEEIISYECTGKKISRKEITVIKECLEETRGVEEENDRKKLKKAKRKYITE